MWLLIIRLTIQVDLRATDVLSSLDVNLEYLDFLNVKLVATSKSEHGTFLIANQRVRTDLWEIIFLT